MNLFFKLLLIKYLSIIYFKKLIKYKYKKKWITHHFIRGLNGLRRTLSSLSVFEHKSRQTNPHRPVGFTRLH